MALRPMTQQEARHAAEAALPTLRVRMLQFCQLMPCGNYTWTDELESAWQSLGDALDDILMARAGYTFVQDGE